MISIRWRIVLTFTICALSGFFVLFHTVSKEVKPRFREALEESLIETAYALAGVVSAESTAKETLSFEDLRGAFSLDTSRVDAKVYSLKKQQLDLRVYLTDATGKVVYHSHRPSEVGRDYGDWNDVYHTLRGTYGARTTRDVPDDPSTTVLYIAAPIKVDGQLLGALSIGKPALHNNSFIVAAKNKLLFLAIIVALVVLSFSLLTFIWISRPLESLFHYVEELRKGTSTLPPSLGNNEIGELAELIGTMTSQLESKHYIHKYLQSLTHELKSPLSSIVGASELLEEHQLVSKQGDRFLSNIQHEAKRMERLISRMLELSTIKHGMIEKLEHFDLAAMLTECLSTKRSQLEERKLELEYSSFPEAELCGDRFLLLLAFSSLLQNAIDFSPEQGKISIEGKSTTHYIVQISDQGPGVPPWAEKKIFDSFFSLPRPSSGRKSSGLGLPLAQAIITLHKGQLDYISAKGGGATFTVTLPVSPSKT